jgi:hypothetical protein
MNGAYTGPPMTQGNAAPARVRFIVWCLDCTHQVEPDRPRLLSATTPQLLHRNGVARLVRGQCGSRRVDMVVSGTGPR